MPKRFSGAPCATSQGSSLEMVSFKLTEGPTRFWWIPSGLSSGKTSTPRPAQAPGEGQSPAHNVHRQPPAAPTRGARCLCRGCRSYVNHGGDAAARLDALGGTPRLCKARGANLPLSWRPAAAGSFLPGSVLGARPAASWSTSCSHPNYLPAQTPTPQLQNTYCNKRLHDGIGSIP